MTTTLAEVCTITMGQAPTGDSYNARGEGLPLIAGAGDFKGQALAPTKFTTKPGKVSKLGDIVLSIRASIGAKVWADGEYCLGRGVAGLRPGPELDDKYLWHWLTRYERDLASKGRGATFLQVNKTDIGEMPIVVPALPEQRRIAAILDHADALRTKRRQVLTHLEALPQSLYQHVFGDPARNPYGFPMRSIRSIAEKFRDGPFGSNLKSSHYVASGVPVVRLQNIGVGKYLDHDRAFVSDDHYSNLSKHDCKPGDVLIGTLGDPNLRACIQPDSLPRALNKADCIQFRPNPEVATSAWACWLLNMPGTLAMASALAHGQTRTRISMGQLRELQVPVPPLSLQRKFASALSALEAQHISIRSAISTGEELFTALQSRAFRGEL